MSGEFRAGVFKDSDGTFYIVQQRLDGSFVAWMAKLIAPQRKSVAKIPGALPVQLSPEAWARLEEVI